MLGGELKARQARLLNEQQARIQKEKAKREKEAAIAARQKEREQAREEELRRKRSEEQAAAEAVSGIILNALQGRLRHILRLMACCSTVHVILHGMHGPMA